MHRFSVACGGRTSHAAVILALAAFFLTVLVGCSDSSDHSKEFGPNIATDVPSKGASKITTISTSGAIFDRSERVLPPEQVGPNGFLMLASNPDDDIFLAAHVASGEPVPELSVESTAVALTLIAQSRLPETVSTSTFVRNVSGSTSFPQLVGAVRSSLDRGESPGNDPLVWSAIFDVLRQIAPTLSTPSSNQFRPLGLERPSLQSPLPRTLIDGGPGNLKVTVAAAAPTVQGVTVRNGLPVNFALLGKTIDTDEAIGELEDDMFGQPQVALRSRTLWSLDTYEEALVPGNAQAWNLRIFKSDSARMKDVTGLTEDVISILARDFYSEICIEAIAEAFITTRWATMSLNGDEPFRPAFWLASLSDVSVWLDLAQTLPSCAGAGLAAGGLGESAKRVAKFLVAPLKFLDYFVSVTEATTRAFYISRYWQHDSTVGVCQDGADSELRVVLCIRSLALESSLATIQLGQTIELRVLAFDELGRPADFPSNQTLEFTSSREDLLPVSTAGEVTALGLSDSPIIVQVQIPQLGLSVATSVQVIEAPAISVSLTTSASSVAVGQSFELVWSTANANSCVASGSWLGPSSTSGRIEITLNNEGVFPYRLDCEGAGQASFAAVEIEVLANNGAGEGLAIRIEDVTIQLVTEPILSFGCERPTESECSVAVVYGLGESEGGIITFTIASLAGGKSEFSVLLQGADVYASSQCDSTNAPELGCASLLRIDRASKRIIANGLVLEGIYFNADKFGDPVSVVLSGAIEY